MTTKKLRAELEVEYGRRNIEQLFIVWSALTKAVEKGKTITDIVVGAKAPSEAWKILNSMVEDDSSERAREQAKKYFEKLSMDDADSMKKYITRAKSLALNVQYHDIEVSEQEISRRVLDGLPSSYAPEKRNFALKTDFSLAEPEDGLVRVEEFNRSSEGTDDSHTLAAGSKTRSGGGAGDVEATMAADGASTTVKVGRRINGSRNISRGISESSSPRISRNNSSTSRGTSESSPRISSNISGGTSNISDRSRNRSTRGISSDICRRSPHSIQDDGVDHAFISGVVNTGIFCQNAVRYAGAQAATYSYSEDYADFGSGPPPPPPQSAPAPPDPHGPPVPSKSSSSSFSEQAILAQFTSPGKLKVSNESVVGDVTVPGSYLHSALKVQSGSNEDDVWIADSGASCHMTHDRTRIYNVRPPPPGRETITIGDRRGIKVEYIGNMDVVFHGKSDQRITLIDVAYVPGLGFNLYSLHAVQTTHLIVSDASGTHIIGANLAFPLNNNGSYLRATWILAGTVGARRSQEAFCAANLLRQLRHPIPPPPQEMPPHRNMCATVLHYSNVPRVVTVLEPAPFPPLSSVLGEIQFVGKTPSRPECRIGTPLATAALTPGPLKHSKEVDINHLQVSLAHAHASVLKATAKQHRIRLTGELVSCPACS